MKTMTLRYPGDPPQKVEVINRQEFFDIFPPDDRQIVVSHFDPDTGKTETDLTISLGVEIFCDFCNEDPNDLIYLVRRSRAYCQSCYEQLLARYCK